MNAVDMAKFDDKISSNVAETDVFRSLFRDRMNHEEFRSRILQIFNEQTNTVSFSKKVKKYAGEEMDNRVFRSVRYWGVVVVTSLISGIIGILMTSFLGK